MTRAKLLFTISCVLLSFSSFGQIRIIEKGLEEFIDGQFVQTVPGGTEDLSGTTQLVSIAGDNSTNKFIIWVVNESTTETYDVVCRRLETSVIPGTLNNTCWSLCPFPDKPAGEAPDWIVAPNNDPTNYFVESIAPGDTITSFEQKYFAESIAGCSDFELRFENANNLGEIYASFNVSFGTPDCINSLEEIEAIETLKMYPNPSNDFVNLDLTNLENDVIILVTNLLGEKVREIKNVRSNGLFNLDTKDLENGFYNVSIFQNDKIKRHSTLSIVH